MNARAQDDIDLPLVEAMALANAGRFDETDAVSSAF